MGQSCMKIISNESESGSIIEYDTQRQKVVCYYSKPWYKRIFIKKQKIKQYVVPVDDDDEEKKLNITYSNGFNDFYTSEYTSKNNKWNFDNLQYTDNSNNTIDMTPYKDF